jgi:hypothetical protein
MLSPFIYNLIPPLFNDLSDLGQFCRIHPAGLHQGYRAQPKLGIFLRGLDVDVRWFISFETKEEESITRFAENFGHDVIIPIPARHNT